MKWWRVGAGGELEEVDAAELTRELLEADAAAGPKPGSRDWMPCPKCKTKGLRAECRFTSGRELGDMREGWECPTCGILVSTALEPPGPDGLSRFDWSRVRHVQCGIFGHSACLPDAWLSTLRVEDDRVVSEVLGSFELRLAVANPPPFRDV